MLYAYHIAQSFLLHMLEVGNSLQKLGSDHTWLAVAVARRQTVLAEAEAASMPLALLVRAAAAAGTQCAGSESLIKKNC